jgi:flagellar biosynthesis activator protein FlaF
MQRNGIEAYTTVDKATSSGRELEASVLMKAALLLKGCKDNWGQPGNEQNLRDALRMNQRIWTFFQVELTQPDNPLPLEIKQNLLNLSVFIDKRTFDITAYPEAEKLDAIININMNIAAGLRQ